MSSIDSVTAVRSADIRLFLVDSIQTLKTKAGLDSVEYFVDSARTRLGTTDSTGAFLIRALIPGRYLVNIRRFGFEPIQGMIVADSEDVGGFLVMKQTSRMLAEVRVIEGKVDVVSRRLQRMGFEDRSKQGLAANFIDRKEILKRRPLKVGDLLNAYGIREGDFILDRMPLAYNDIRDYPAALVIGVEIYRHGRPQEFNMIRSGPGMMSSPNAAALKPLTVIWTYIPGQMGESK